MKLHDNLIPIIVLILTITLIIKNEGFATIFKKVNIIIKVMKFKM